MSTSPTRMPAVFYGHGSPMNALGGPYAQAWRDVGEAIPRPRAILMISAHWFIDDVAVTVGERPETIYDFYGFPPALSAITYPAPGDGWLAGRVSELLGPTPVRAATDWGLDHGTWSVLVHSYPDADVPVVQLSIDRGKDAGFHYKLAQKLKPLRDEGVLIAGSGDVVHNLRVMRRDGTNTVYDWAQRFSDTVKAHIVSGDHDPLIDYATLGEDAQLAINSAEHYLPLLYVLAQQAPGETVRFFNERIDLGSVDMMGFQVG
jgi:4,5-DOPA dioxygenase extradiol